MFTLTLGILALCSLAAFVAGFIDSIAGGGGLITIPALLLAGVPPHYALGTNKVQACVGTTVSLAMFASGHLVLWRLALLGLPFSLAGSAMGSSLALYLDSAVLGKILLGLLPFAMCMTLLPKRKEDVPALPLEGARFWTATPLISTCIGCYDGFFGPGTGTFFILAFHWVLRQGLVQASATTKVLNLASNFSAMVVFIWNGKVLWPLAACMLAASVAGNWLGSRTAMRIGARAVRFFLTISLALLMATLVWRYVISPAL
ncbi:MAG: TSUP family transporter [Desulfovibrionaceae bacterium]|nr:TSUP family transporter [Desulfovibrionaceae bacterium]